MRTLAATLGVSLVLLTGCGNDGAEAPPEPSEVDRANAASATVTAADLEGIPGMPGQAFLESTLTAECRKQGLDIPACSCALDALLSEISAVEFSLLALDDRREGLRAAADALVEAFSACQAGRPPSDLGLSDLGGGPIEITPETVRQFIPTEERAAAVAVNSCVREGNPEAACGCVNSDLLEDFDAYEATVLGFSMLADREVTPYFRGVLEGCEVEL